MGVVKMILLLLLVISNCNFSVSFFKDANNYSEKPPIYESNGSLIRGSNGGVNQSKFVRASSGGGGGRATGEGSNESGGQSNSSPQQGGGAAIPVYVAGSRGAANHSNHNTANTCRRCKNDRLLVVIVTIITLLLLNLSI
ncbi:hypothetical protein SSX86_017889 [Deinandra increscens subsp. villosa]|uniref:Glycine-rich protein n=1 Tax=Deinandra increscens subsp. villosa TaxID=3103831 RepID=A0AAP0GXG4_9ASTR